MVVPSIKKVGRYDFGDRYCTFSDNYGDDGAMIYAIGRPSTSAHGSHGFARGSCGFTRSLCNAIRCHCFLLLNPFRSLPLQHLVLWLSVDIVVVVLRLQFVVVAH